VCPQRRALAASSDEEVERGGEDRRGSRADLCRAPAQRRSNATTEGGWVKHADQRMLPCLLSPLKPLAFPGDAAYGRCCEARPLQVAVDVGRDPSSARATRGGDASTISTAICARVARGEARSDVEPISLRAPAARLGLRGRASIAAHREAEIYASVNHNIWAIALIMGANCNSPMYSVEFPCSLSVAVRLVNKDHGIFAAPVLPCSGTPMVDALEEYCRRAQRKPLSGPGPARPPLLCAG
jgi:hypothetical protein